MRRLVIVALAPFIALAACIAAPDDPPTASTSQALTPSCGPGEKLVCGSPIGVPVHGLPVHGTSSGGSSGGTSCVCEYLSCSNLVYPPAAQQPGSFNIAFARAGSSCPDIVTSQGTWAQIDSRPTPPCWSYMGGAVWTGVPTLDALYETNSPVGNVCEQVLNTASCCTYVWWPNGYATSSDPLGWDGEFAPADSQALCGGPAYTAVSVAYFNATLTPGTNSDGGIIMKPGGGGKCGACSAQ